MKKTTPRLTLIKSVNGRFAKGCDISFSSFSIFTPPDELYKLKALVLPVKPGK